MSEQSPTQKEILEWAANTFGSLALDTRERSLRFIEEAIELAQACQITPEEIQSTVTRVYSRERGDPHKETGQAYMTLAALAEWLRIDLNDALLREWRRVQGVPLEEWVKRHNAKVELGIATPMTPTPQSGNNE